MAARDRRTGNDNPNIRAVDDFRPSAPTNTRAATGSKSGAVATHRPATRSNAGRTPMRTTTPASRAASNNALSNAGRGSANP